MQCSGCGLDLGASELDQHVALIQQHHSVSTHCRPQATQTTSLITLSPTAGSFSSVSSLEDLLELDSAETLDMPGLGSERQGVYGGRDSILAGMLENPADSSIAAA